MKENDISLKIITLITDYDQKKLIRIKYKRINKN